MSARPRRANASAPLKPTQPSSPSFHTSIMEGASGFSLNGANFNNVSGDQHNNHNNDYSTVKDSYNRYTTNNSNRYKTHQYRDYQAFNYTRNNLNGRKTARNFSDDDSDDQDFGPGFDDTYDDNFEQDSEDSDAYQEQPQDRRYGPRKVIPAPRRAPAPRRTRPQIEQPVVAEDEQHRAMQSIYTRGKADMSQTKARSRVPQKEPEYAYERPTNARRDQSQRAYPTSSPPPSRSASRPAFTSQPSSRAQSSSGSEEDPVVGDLSEHENDAVEEIESKPSKPKEPVQAPSSTSSDAAPTKASPRGKAAAATVPSPDKTAPQNQPPRTTSIPKKKGRWPRWM